MLVHLVSITYYIPRISTDYFDTLSRHTYDVVVIVCLFWYTMRLAGPGWKSRGHQADSTGGDLGGCFKNKCIGDWILLVARLPAGSELSSSPRCSSLAPSSYPMLATESGMTTHPTYRVFIPSLLYPSPTTFLGSPRTTLTHSVVTPMMLL